MEKNLDDLLIENSRLKLKLAKASMRITALESIIESARQTWIQRGSDNAIKQLILDNKYGVVSSKYRNDII